MPSNRMTKQGPWRKDRIDTAIYDQSGVCPQRRVRSGRRRRQQERLRNAPQAVRSAGHGPMEIDDLRRSDLHSGGCTAGSGSVFSREDVRRAVLTGQVSPTRTCRLFRSTPPDLSCHMPDRPIASGNGSAVPTKWMAVARIHDWGKPYLRAGELQNLRPRGAKRRACPRTAWNSVKVTFPDRGLALGRNRWSPATGLGESSVIGVHMTRRNGRFLVSRPTFQDRSNRNLQPASRSSSSLVQRDLAGRSIRGSGRKPLSAVQIQIRSTGCFINGGLCA